MRIKNKKTKMHRVSMNSEEMCVALFFFRKVIAHEHFMPVRMRLSNALLDMGLDACSQEWHEASKQYEKLFSKTMLNQTKQL